MPARSTRSARSDKTSPTPPAEAPSPGGGPLNSTSVDRPVPDYPADARHAPGIAADRRRPRVLRRGPRPRGRARPSSEAIQVYENGRARRSRRSRCPTRSTACPPITSSRRPSARATWPATTARSTATAPPTSRPGIPARTTSPPLIRMMMASRAEGFGAEVKRRIMLGTFALSAGYADQYYNQALQGPPPDPQRLRRRLPGGGRPDRPDLAHAGVPARREDRRPAGDVPLGHLHHHHQPGGYPGNQHPLRPDPGRTSRSASSSWPRRSPRRPCCAPRGSSRERPIGIRSGRSWYDGGRIETLNPRRLVADLQAAAADRPLDAEALLAAGRHSAAIATGVTTRWRST